METDLDPLCVSPTTEEDGNAVSRPPLKGVRKRLDTGPGDIPGVRPRDTPEYRRVTEMISELIDLRAHMEERTGVSAGHGVDSAGALSSEQTRSYGYRPLAVDTDRMVEDTNGPKKKKKKKKKKSQKNNGGVVPVDQPARALEPIGHPRRDVGPRRPLAGGGRAGAGVPPVQHDLKNTWTTVVGRRARSGGPPIPAEEQVLRKGSIGVPAGDRLGGPARAGARQQQWTAATRPAMRKVPKTAAVSVLCTTPV